MALHNFIQLLEYLDYLHFSSLKNIPLGFILQKEIQTKIFRAS